MTKRIGLAKHAFVGAPAPLTKSVPFGNDNHELRSKAPKWNYKPKRLRRQEILDRL